jgi:hypothetical protein
MLSAIVFEFSGIGSFFKLVVNLKGKFQNEKHFNAFLKELSCIKRL